jgi:hypothetical protein
MILGYYFIDDLGDGEAVVRFFREKGDCDLAAAAKEQRDGYVLGGTEELHDEDFK